MITKAERSELRTLIRQRFRVLRADVEARKAELLVELEERINAKYAAEDKAWSDAMFVIDQARLEANRKANDVLRSLDVEGLEIDPKRDYDVISTRAIVRPTKHRTELRSGSIARIEAQVKAAGLELDRQEADLLTRLVVDALESEAARAFLGQIPTVSTLVPKGRLLELVGLIDGETA